jgi:hypothetical protein
MRNRETRNKKTRKRNKRGVWACKAGGLAPKSTKKQGGRAVDAGSYGCVFIPALKCKNNTRPYDNNYVSKLMYKEDTESEMDEMKKVEAIVKNIPNNENYFIISQTYACDPDKITSEENLKTFDLKCKLFTKRGIDKTNVNDKLHKLSLLNMPNGGLNIEKFGLKMLESTDKYSVFINLNFALVDLLKNGIVPMIRQRFNHYDIKAGNILYSSDGYARLIDWGLAGSNDGKTIPEAIKNRSIAFNMPFSDIFFNSYIKQWLPEEMRKIKASLNFRDKNDGQRELLKVVAVNMINKSIEETSEGHFEYITGNILHDIYKIYASKGKYDLLDYNVLAFNVLIEYIQAVLIKYVDENGNFNDIGYFYDVFVHNVDIWGFVMTYAPIVEDGADKMHKDVINGICRILLKYCFSPEFAIKQINVNELALDLLSLNDIARSVTPNKIPTHKIPVHKIPVNKLPLNKLSVNKIPNITFNHSMLTPASATPKE